MSNKKQKKYLDGLWAGVSDSLRSFLTDGDPKQLHHLRVNVKKLRAFFALGDNHAIRKHFKPVQKLFKHAGQIRDGYNSLEIGQEFQVGDGDFKNAQHQLISQLTDEFKINGPRYLKSVRKARKAIRDDIRLPKSGKIYVFYTDSLEEIAVQFAQPHTDEELHANRRLIKNLVYNHVIAPKKIDTKLHLDKEYIDKLQTSIGDWHDAVVAMDVLKDAAPVEVITKIKNRKTRLRRGVKTLATDFKTKATAGKHEEEKPENK